MQTRTVCIDIKKKRFPQDNNILVKTFIFCGVCHVIWVPMGSYVLLYKLMRIIHRHTKSYTIDFELI